MEQKSYMNAKVKIKDSVAVIEGTISPETLEKHRKAVISDIKKDIELPGFRKGNAPEDMVRSSLGENRLLEEAANSALHEVYPQIVDNEKLDVIAVPRIVIKKLALGNPLEFEITVAIMPELSLPHYKKIAEEIMKKKEVLEVSEQEISDVLSEILKMRGEEIKLEDLTDASAGEFGSFKTMKELREKIGENLKEEKQINAQKKIRQEILKKIAEETKVTIPQMLIDDELETTKTRLFEELEKRSLSKEEYFSQIKKTEEELWSEERIVIKHELTERFALKGIAEKEKIVPDEQQVEHELSHLKEHYPDADPLRLRAYVLEILVNEKVFELLEKTD